MLNLNLLFWQHWNGFPEMWEKGNYLLLRFLKNDQRFILKSWLRLSRLCFCLHFVSECFYKWSVVSILLCFRTMPRMFFQTQLPSQVRHLLFLKKIIFLMKDCECWGRSETRVWPSSNSLCLHSYSIRENSLLNFCLLRRKEVKAKSKNKVSQENQEPVKKKKKRRKSSSSHSKKHKHKKRRGSIRLLSSSRQML